MGVSLKIDHAACIGCRRCVRVCPAAIFYQEAVVSESQTGSQTGSQTKSPIAVRNLSYCIVCGHCAAVCPTGAVAHGDFPPGRIHRTDPAALPSPESVMLLCKTRRSNRGFSHKPVPAEAIELILEAAHRAPTASNRQEVEYTLITDAEQLRQVTEYTMKAFDKIIGTLKNPLLRPILRRIMPDNYKMLRRMERLQKEYAKGNDPILRGATALILIHTPADNRFGRDDANLAYQNGSLMAEALGVAQFYTGYVCTAIRRDRKNTLAKMLGTGGTIHAGMALGMPDFTYPNYIDRKPIKVTRLE